MVGLCLQALALNAGPLAVAQPLLVLGMLFALPLQRRLRCERIRRRELVWALVLVVGLAGFLVVATAGVPAAPEAVAQGPAIAASVLAAGAAVGCVFVSARSPARRRSGIARCRHRYRLAATATLIKACTNLWVRSPVSLITSWQLCVAGCR